MKSIELKSKVKMESTQEVAAAVAAAAVAAAAERALASDTAKMVGMREIVSAFQRKIEQNEEYNLEVEEGFAPNALEDDTADKSDSSYTSRSYRRKRRRNQKEKASINVDVGSSTMHLITIEKLQTRLQYTRLDLANRDVSISELQMKLKQYETRLLQYKALDKLYNENDLYLSKVGTQLQDMTVLQLHKLQKEVESCSDDYKNRMEFALCALGARPHKLLLEIGNRSVVERQKALVAKIAQIANTKEWYEIAMKGSFVMAIIIALLAIIWAYCATYV